MNFTSIVRKNFIYNYNKYISFYFVNSLIVGMLFMYGSLMYNNTVLDSIGKTPLYETIKIALFGIIIFSIVFITYTNIAFLKNRGKEFGMYLTLGMTIKDLTKLIIFENLVIMLVSSITGILGGALFGRMFYMGLNKILNSTPIAYELHLKTFQLSIGIFGLIFFTNLLFNIPYIRKVSIIDAIKSSKKKEIGKSNIFIGTISLILFTVSIYCLPKTLFKEIFIQQSYMIGIFIVLIIVCPYILIGSMISILKIVLKRFPKIYNKNLLGLSSLSHRFLAYKNTLYMISILVTGSIFFVGFSYSVFATTKSVVDINNPFDIMFVESNICNKVNESDIERVLTKSNENIDNYKVLEYIEVPMFKKQEGQYIFWSKRKTIISETNFNKHMGTNIDIKPSNGINVTVANEKMDYNYPTVILSAMNPEQLKKIMSISRNNDYISEDDYKNIVENTSSLVLDEYSIQEQKGVKFTNFYYSEKYMSGDAFIVDDRDYEILKGNLVDSSYKKLHLINIENGENTFSNLIKYLKEKNGLDNSYWTKANMWGRTLDDERSIKEAYRPIYKEETLSLLLANNGMTFFTMMFIGLLFLIANGIVLYYKVLSDISEEQDRIKSLKRIGIRDMELKNIISKELAITFFVPILVGGGLGLYFLYVMTSNSEITKQFMSNIYVILFIVIIIQFQFYIISRRKYIKEVSKSN